MKKYTDHLNPTFNLMYLESSDQSNNYEKQIRRNNYNWNNCCSICGKWTPRPTNHFYMVLGGGYYCHPDHIEYYYHNDSGLIGVQPVGSECAKQISDELKEFLVRSDSFDFLKELNNDTS